MVFDPRSLDNRVTYRNEVFIPAEADVILSLGHMCALPPIPGSDTDAVLFLQPAADSALLTRVQGYNLRNLDMTGLEAGVREMLVERFAVNSYKTSGYLTTAVASETLRRRMKMRPVCVKASDTVALPADTNNAVYCGRIVGFNGSEVLVDHGDMRSDT